MRHRPVIRSVPTVALRPGSGTRQIDAPVAPSAVRAAPASRSSRAHIRSRTEAAILLALDVLALAVVLLTTERSHGALALTYAVVAIAFLFAFGGYRSRLELKVLDDVPRLAKAGAAALLTITLIARVPERIVPQALLSGLALLALRLAAYRVICVLRCHGLVDRSIIVGAGHIAVELHRLLDQHPEFGFRPVGVVDDVVPSGDVPLLGGIADLESVIAEQDARCVIVAFGPGGERDLVATLRGTVERAVEVYIVPRLFELGQAPAGHHIETVWAIPLHRVRRGAIRNATWRTKRMFDAAVSGLLLVLLAPVLGALALAVKCTSSGPILFRQKRIGQRGREIEVLKFRSMAVNEDADFTWSVENDPRVTAVGRWLRRSSLDELPQLWNVLRGDMSLVGPRPERPQFVDTFVNRIDGYGDRHRLPAGLTGLAQVHGLRGDTSIVERTRFDNFYIEHWSPWQDAKIILRTGAAVVRDALRDRSADRPALGPVLALPPSTLRLLGGQGRSGRRCRSHRGAARRSWPRAVWPAASARPARAPSISDRSLLFWGNVALAALLLRGAAGAALMLAVAGPVALALVRRPQRGLLVLLALVPFDGLLDIVPHPGWASAWKEALVVAILGATFIAPNSTRRSPGHRPPSWLAPVGGLVAVSLCSAVVIGGVAAIYGLKISFFYLLLAWAIWRCPPDASERDRMVTVLFVTGVLTALYGLVQQGLGPDRLNALGYEYNTTIRFAGGLLRSFSSFADPFSFGFYEMAVMLVCLGVALADPKRLRSRLFFACMPIMFAGMLSTVVRGAWLGFAAGIIYLGIRRYRGLLLVIPLVLVGLLILPSETSSKAALSSQSSQERVSGWSDRARIVLSHPFGTGLGSSGAAAEKAQTLRGVRNPSYYTPDNQFFLVLYELGVLGLWFLVSLFAAVLGSLRRAERSLTGADRGLAVGATAMVVAATVASLFASYLQIFPLDVLWWSLVAVVTMTATSGRPATAPVGAVVDA